MSTTEVERDNIELIRRGFAAFAAADMAALAELFDENAVWHGEPTGILTGDYHGRDAIFPMFGQLHQESGGTFRSTPVAMAASGDRVFVQAKATGERKGRSLRADSVLIFTLTGGRVREVQLFNGNYSATQEFWA